jgi:hypothetical protein
MAELVLGVGTSHGPLLNTPPDRWGERAVADYRNTALAFRGQDYTFEELNALREGAFAVECDPEVQRRRHAACRDAIRTLGEVVDAAGLDALVVVSSDHKEVFDDELLPQFAVYHGDTVQHEPFTKDDLEAMPPGIAVAEVANVPAVSTTRTCHPALAVHLIRQTSAAGFDPCASRQLPAGRYGNHGIPHGWGFVHQQVLGGNGGGPDGRAAGAGGEIPFVPVFVNTFYEPNQPTAERCYDFGVALGRAVASFPGDLRVGVVASGGLSHFVVDEELDRAFLAALERGDADHLASLPDALLRSGTSELRNWIVAAGAAVGAGLRPDVLAYEPCYRSEAGTGCAMGFVTWQPDGGARS